MVRKKIQERYIDQYFHRFIIEFFDLPYYKSESRKIYTKVVVYVSEGGEWILIVALPRGANNLTRGGISGW